MNLYRIEYSVKSTGQRIICHSVGMNQDDVIQDIVSVVGEITVLNFYHVTEVHRISGSIRKQIFDTFLKITKASKRLFHIGWRARVRNSAPLRIFVKDAIIRIP